MPNFLIKGKWYNGYNNYKEANDAAIAEAALPRGPVAPVVPVGGPAPLNPLLALIQGVATPLVNLPTRGGSPAQRHLGVGEQVRLTLNAPLPPGTKVKWSVQGDAELPEPNANAPILTAGPTPGIIAATLKVDGGPHNGHQLSRHEFKVIAPSGTVTRQDPNTQLRHDAGTAGVGFKMWINLLPATVVFNRVQWREHIGLGLATGHFEGENGRVHAPSGVPYDANNQPTSYLSQAWMTVYEPYPAPHGVNWVGQVDTVDTGSHPPAVPGAGATPPAWKPSSHKWHIEWKYRVMKSDDKFFSGEFLLEKAMHEATIKADGTSTIKKGDAGPFSVGAGAATTNFV